MIRRVRVLSHENDLGGRVWNPALVWTRKYAVFVEIELDGGLTGLGECWCFDTAPDALVAFLRSEVAPSLPGRALDEIPGHLAALARRATLSARHGMLASALSGVDMAVQDLGAQRAGLPLWQHLAAQSDRPGAAPGRVRLYGSGGLYGRDKGLPELAAEMAGMAAQGFGMVKMKVGGLDPASDLARVRAVLDALPAGVELVIDGVYSYAPEAAHALWQALPAARMAAFQSPVAAHDWEGMRALTAAGVPVMAVEAEYRPEIHRALIDMRAVRFLQVAPVACGGPSRVLELARAVRGTGIELSLEVSSTAVATLAAAHLAAACPEIAHVEHHFLHQVFFDRLALGRPDGTGLHALPGRPGLGITLPGGATTRHFTLTRTGPEPQKAGSDPRHPGPRTRGMHPDTETET